MRAEQLDINGCINLIGGIIKQAIEDLTHTNEKIQKSAKKFLYSNEFERYCSRLGADSSLIREKAGLPNVDESVLLEHKPLPTAKIPLMLKAPKDMTPAELKEYRAMSRRKYNAKRRAKQFAICTQANYLSTN